MYNPAKPTRFGIKLYQVCESKTGYCLGFDIYTGSTRGTDYCEAMDIPDSCNKTTRIVLGLLARCGLHQKGHNIFMDNFYTSPELFNELDLLETICMWHTEEKQSWCSRSHQEKGKTGSVPMPIPKEKQFASSQIPRKARRSYAVNHPLCNCVHSEQE